MGALIDWGVAERAFPAQVESGDGYLVAPARDGVLIAVIDGLGHGPDAARATRAAVAELEARPGEQLVTLVRICHGALRKTQGAVMSLAWLTENAQMTWLGVGNVEGVLLRLRRVPAFETLAPRAGVIGFQLPPLHASRLCLDAGDILVFATDGIGSGFTRAGLLQQSRVFRDTPKQLADYLFSRYAKASDDALVLVARYLGAVA